MGTLWLWAGFNFAVLVLLGLDLFVVHRRPHAIKLGEAALWSAVWIALSLGFNLLLWRWYGSGPALEFLTGYVIEKSLSVDNLFVFALLFHSFAVETRWQHRVLFWGILGALLMRGALIAAGVTLVRNFHWVLYIFGAFLIVAGWKMLRRGARAPRLEKNPVLRFVRRFLPIEAGYSGGRFFVRRPDGWRATPLLLVLLLAETADLVFALDSIPAVFAVTRNPFVVYSSNICALLGLRALYFLLAGSLRYFRYLPKGLSILLFFVGLKMLVEPWVRIPTPAALAAVAVILAAAILASLFAAPAAAGAPPDGAAEVRRDSTGG
jgi:TerC family integral membrane protein